MQLQPYFWTSQVSTLKNGYRTDNIYLNLPEIFLTNVHKRQVKVVPKNGDSKVNRQVWQMRQEWWIGGKTGKIQGNSTFVHKIIG